MTGYDENFLGEGFSVRLPRLVDRIYEEALDNGQVYDFQHFSLVMNQKRRFAIYVAHNIDRGQLQNISRKGTRWWIDPRIGDRNQVGEEVYRNNPWDRGHLARRSDVCWGTEAQAQKANRDSFCYANAALQHSNFNADEWSKLEEWILKHQENSNGKLCVFTGPVNAPSDRPYRGVQIPAAFWKVIFYASNSQTLDALAFLMKQDEFWDDSNGAALINLVNYQVTLNEISALTGLEFEDRLYDANPLFYFKSKTTAQHDIQTPERRIIKSEEDILYARDFYPREE